MNFKRKKLDLAILLRNILGHYKQFKKCSKCSKNKRLVCFNKNTSSSDGFLKDGTRQRQRTECAECTQNVNKGANQAKKLAKTMGIPYVAPSGTCCKFVRKQQVKEMLLYSTTATKRIYSEGISAIRAIVVLVY